MVVVTALNMVVVIMAHFARFEKYRFLLAWAFVLLALVLGIRYGYGNDYFSYKYMFDHGYPEQGFTDDVEPGWFILNKLFKPFGFSAFVFFLTCIEHLMLYDLIRRYVSPQYYWFAVFLYVFHPYYMLIGLSMMRQFLVQLLGFYAMEYAFKKKIIHFVVIVLFAITIHKVALLLLPLYLFPYTSKLFANKFAIVFLIIVVGVIAIYINVIIENLVLFFADAGMKYGDSYLSESDLNEEYRIPPMLVLRYVLYAILLVRNYKLLNDSNPSRFYVVEVMLGLLFIPFVTLSTMAIRTSWVYTMVIIISMPILLNKEKMPVIKYGSMFIFCVLLLREYRNFFYSEIWGAQYINFYTIFSEYGINNIRLF